MVVDQYLRCFFVAVEPEQVVNFNAIMAQFDGKEQELLDQLNAMKGENAVNCRESVRQWHVYRI